MITDPGVFRDLAYIFIAAVLGGGLAWITRQPLILGYVVGGIVIGPFTPGPVVTHTHTFEVFALRRSRAPKLSVPGYRRTSRSDSPIPRSSVTHGPGVSGVRALPS